METKSQATQFESSQMVGSLLASTPLLADAWRQCNLANTTAPGGFVIDRIGDVAYVAFSGVQTISVWNPGGGSGTRGCYGEIPIITENNLFSALRDHDGEAATVYAGFLHLFLSIHNSLEFQSKIMATMSNNKSVVFAGHSLGGAIASLTALSFLSSFPSLSSTHSLLCITFGSPLLGNKALSTAILAQRWGHHFCHITSIHDLVPRLLFSPLPPISTHLTHLLNFWHSHMQFPQFSSKSAAIGLGESEVIEFYRFISTHVSNAAATNRGDADQVSPFRPFGSYLFCSKEGAICIDNPSSIIQMLYHLMGSVGCSVEDHLAYGDLVVKISQQFLQRRRFDVRGSQSSNETGILLALEALGIKTQDSVASGPTRECLMMATKLGDRPNLNSAGLAIKLAKVNPCRAQIEWYKAYCNEHLTGYYDSFKHRLSPKRDSAVNMARIKLSKFWDRVIGMVQLNELPHDFHRHAKWVNASQFYKLLVEPLDIAEYYRTGKHRIHGHYIVGGRERRYQMFDKWWEQRKMENGTHHETKRRTLAGLTQDSCFWARVEEAKEWVESARNEEDARKLAELWRLLERFEGYSKGLVERKEVSGDVLFEESSYVLWVKDWEELKVELAMRLPYQGPSYMEGVSTLSRN